VPAFSAAKTFAVNILTAEQKDISQHYSRRSAHTLASGHFGIGKTGLPVLHDTLANFECEIWQRYEGGDHVLLVGKVIAMHNNDRVAKPLIFFGGGYQDLRG
jgi:flavin reductase (DIM6/NTAB) family NADH-FMN oxidoreductase RutF